MSVTPDFVGQRYTDTNTGNIWIANSTTPGDWTLEVQNYRIKWLPTSQKLDQKCGFFSAASLPGITEIVFEQSAFEQFVYVSASSNVTSVSAPNLISIDLNNVSGADFQCAGNSALETVSFPLLEHVQGTFEVSGNPLLTTLQVPNLQTVPGGDVSIRDNALLTAIDLGSLLTTDDITCDTNPSITSLDISSLQTADDISAFDCPSLSSVLINPTPTSITGQIDFTGCGLSAASVNAILAALVAVPAWNVAANLSGGTNAAPSGQGITDKATLIGRGATVVTN